MSDDWYIPASEEHVAREKSKARDLRDSQWWKNRRGEGRCHYCGAEVPPKELTMDHVVPIARGGRTDRGNVVPCCKECNNTKRDLLPVEWEEHLARLRQS
jgi:5-methylcytosine-specific restriction protein A